jgi:hypothetical protein
VQVFSRISGGAPKNIILFQGGVGLSNKTGNFYATDEDVGHIISNKINPEDIYLKTDGIYLFVARHDSSLNIYGISAPPYDRELITTDATLTDAQVLSAAENNPRVREFMNAAGIKTLQSAYQ